MVERKSAFEEEPKMSFADVPIDVIKNVADMCFGFNVLSFKTLIDAGVPFSIVQSLTTMHAFSDANTPFSAPEWGVTGFELLNKICEDLHINTSSLFKGPANVAFDLKEHIDEWIASRRGDTQFKSLLEGLDLELS